MVFEGFFDFLAFITKFRDTNFKYDFIILNGVTLANRAIEKINQIQPIQAQFFLDSDEE